jgi:hypothetical protein
LSCREQGFTLGKHRQGRRQPDADVAASTPVPAPVPATSDTEALAWGLFASLVVPVILVLRGRSVTSAVLIWVGLCLLGAASWSCLRLMNRQRVLLADRQLGPRQDHDVAGTDSVERQG